MVWCRSCSASPASVAELGISVYGLVPAHLRPTSSPSAGVHCRVLRRGMAEPADAPLADSDSLFTKFYNKEIVLKKVISLTSSLDPKSLHFI